MLQGAAEQGQKKSTRSRFPFRRRKTIYVIDRHVSRFTSMTSFTSSCGNFCGSFYYSLGRNNSSRSYIFLVLEIYLIITKYGRTFLIFGPKTLWLVPVTVAVDEGKKTSNIDKLNRLVGS